MAEKVRLGIEYRLIDVFHQQKNKVSLVSGETLSNDMIQIFGRCIDDQNNECDFPSYMFRSEFIVGERYRLERRNNDYLVAVSPNIPSMI